VPKNDLGLALAIQALFAEFEKHFVDPAGHDFTDAQSAEFGNDEIAQDALVLIDRCPGEPLLGSKLLHPRPDQVGDGRPRGDRGVHDCSFVTGALAMKVCGCYLATSSRLVAISGRDLKSRGRRFKSCPCYDCDVSGHRGRPNPR
jgi:hypothetical protein